MGALYPPNAGFIDEFGDNDGNWDWNEIPEYEDIYGYRNFKAKKTKKLRKTF